MTRGRPPKPTAPLARDYLAGNSIDEVAANHKVSTKLVRKALAAEGVERRPTRQTEAGREQAIVRLREDFGLAWTEIAEITGIPASTLHRHYAKAAGVPPSASRRKAAKPPEDLLLDRYQAGRPVAQIAAEFNVDPKTVRQHLRHHGIEPDARPVTRQTLALSDDELRARHASGETYKDLAAACGVSPALIWRRVNFRYPPNR